MKRRRTIYLITLVILLFTVALALAQSGPQSKTPYQRIGSEGTLKGIVSLSGHSPEPMQIDMSADPICYQSNPKPFTEYFVGSEGHLANVLVYVKAGAALEGLSFETQATNVVLDQRGCRFAPRVIGIQVDQTLEVRNSDETTNNVHAMAKLNRDWNQTQVSQSEPLTKRFTLSEIPIPFRDNQHPWKKAYVAVFAHPFFAVSDNKGAFTIEGLPPGNYTIAAWHEQFGEKTFEITIYPGSPQSLDINIDMVDRKVVR